jgi:ABC-type polysaccharide transport system permease subunit
MKEGMSYHETPSFFLGISALVLVLSVVLLVTFTVLPLVITAILSTRDHSGMRPALIGNVDQGLTYYKEFLGSYYLPRLLRNTAALTLLPAVVTAALALPLIFTVSRLPNRICRILALMLLAVPAFVPLTYLTSVFLSVFSFEGRFTQILETLGVLEEQRDLLSAKAYYVPIYTAFETLRFLFFPVLAGVLTLEGRSSGSVAAALKIVPAYILVRLSMTFILDHELASALYRPITYEVSDTLSTFVNRRALIEGTPGAGAAVDVLKLLAQAVLNTGVFIALRALFSTRARQPSHPASHKQLSQPGLSSLPGRRSGLVVSICCIAAFFILASGPVYVTAGLLFPELIVQGAPLGFAGFGVRDFIERMFVNSFLIAAARAILFAAISLILAYPLAARSKSVWTLALVSLSAGALMTTNVLVFEQLGADNTLLGAMFIGSFSCAGAAALSFSLRGRFPDAPSIGEYVRIAWKGVLVLFLLGFAVSWSSNTWAAAILTNRDLYPITVLLKEQSFFGFAAAGRAEDFSLISGIALTAALPPLAAVWTALLLNKKLPSGLLSAGIRT